MAVINLAPPPETVDNAQPDPSTIKIPLTFDGSQNSEATLTTTREKLAYAIQRLQQKGVFVDTNLLAAESVASTVAGILIEKGIIDDIDGFQERVMQLQMQRIYGLLQKLADQDRTSQIVRPPTGLKIRRNA